MTSDPKINHEVIKKWKANTLPVASAELLKSESLSAPTCSAAIAKARRERLWECLETLSEWTAKRAGKEYNTDTTITMLARKVQETMDSVDKAGWRAAKEFKQNEES